MRNLSVRGKRYTCPLCQDSTFLNEEQVAALGGRVMCDNHPVLIMMVDLVELYEILGRGEPLNQKQEEELAQVVDAGLIHPDDFEFEEVQF